MLSSYLAPFQSKLALIFTFEHPCGDSLTAYPSIEANNLAYLRMSEAYLVTLSSLVFAIEDFGLAFVSQAFVHL